MTTMRTLSALVLAGFVIPAAADPTAAPRETCNIIAGEPPEMTLAPAIHVIDLTGADTFTLPAGSLADVGAMVCERLSIVPAENDYKVVLAGFPFAIKTADGKTLWLELEAGRLEVTSEDTTLSEMDTARIQEWLNRVQVFFDQPPDASKASGT